MKSKHIISSDNSLLIVIDVQEKLLPSISGYKEIEQNISRLIRGFKIHKAPIIFTEQYPKGLGKTVNTILKELDGINPIEKLEFSCFQNKEFLIEIEKHNNVKNLVICGIEAHVCVLQSCLDALEYNYNVNVAIDCISSRKTYDYKTGLEKITMCGVLPTTVEMALFELTERAKTPEFKEISNIAKEFTQEKKIGF